MWFQCFHLSFGFLILCQKCKEMNCIVGKEKTNSGLGNGSFEYLFPDLVEKVYDFRMTTKQFEMLVELTVSFISNQTIYA